MIPGGDDFLGGLTGRPTMAEDHGGEEAAMKRLAATTVRRRANQHKCPSGAGGKPLQRNGVLAYLLHKVVCRSRNHRRDVSYMAEMLDMLGLPGDVLAQPEDYDGPVAYYGPMGKREARDWAKNG